MRTITWTMALALLGVAHGCPAQLAHPSPYSNSVSPAHTFTGAGQSTTIQLNGLSSSSTVGSSFAAGTVTVSGTSLTSVSFSVLGSADNGVTFYALPVTPAANPCATAATTVTATSAAQYQVSLAGMTHLRIATSGTFSATTVSMVLTATPNDSDTNPVCEDAQFTGSQTSITQSESGLS
jgi:hypothetical protein